MFNLKRIFKKSKEEIKEVDTVVQRGIFEVEDKLIAGAYYCDNQVKSIATDIGCVLLNNETEPILIEEVNLYTINIENLLSKLKYNKVENFIFVNELC